MTGYGLASASRWTVVGEKAGRQIATYSGAVRFRRTVADPFTGLTENRLAGADFQHAALVFDPQTAGQHERDFLELRPLRRLRPATGRLHAGDAELVVTRASATDEFFDHFWLVARGGDPRGLVDELRHRGFLPSGEDTRASTRAQA